LSSQSDTDTDQVFTDMATRLYGDPDERVGQSFPQESGLVSETKLG